MGCTIVSDNWISDLSIRFRVLSVGAADLVCVRHVYDSGLDEH